MRTILQQLQSRVLGDRKGVLTSAEADQRANRTGTIVTIHSFKLKAFFLSDDHCFGSEVMRAWDFVPCTSVTPMQVKPREGFPDGILVTASDHIAVFNKGERQITSLEELAELIESAENAK